MSESHAPLFSNPHSLAKYESRMRKIFSLAIPEKSYRIILYGSRARGDDRDGSDVDFAISGESITDGDLSHVREFWEESTIPINLDLVDLGKIDDKLTSRIKAEGVTLWIQS